MARFLIVDDDLAVGETFARMLRLEGHEVATVESAPLALESARQSPPDALILDMRMPGSGGLDFLRRLRSDDSLRAVPVGIVTGDYFLKDEVLAELGALGATVRYKPLWMADLSALAATLLGASGTFLSGS
ncbi:MAG TPA: response regulator [Vicinamibacterales bacterium]|nr:response regulator [Vicinamibacterales bacterium]